MGISSTTIKYIQSLRQKKFRDQHASFIAEGDKIIRELLQSPLRTAILCGLPEWLEQNRDIIPGQVEVYSISERDLDRISTLKTPNQVLAVVKKPVYQKSADEIRQKLVLVLDTLQDPGNLGTIIRTADWFGIRDIFCSPATADLYNPKVIQATMGSFLRVRMHYTPLPALLGKMQGDVNIYGASLHGQDMFEVKPAFPAMLVIGNESAGIGQEVNNYIGHTLRIPSAASKPGVNMVHAGAAESLNASVAAGIMMAWFHNTTPKG